MPGADETELLELLRWLTQAQYPNVLFKTSSSDVFCVAEVLHQLGMELRVVRSGTLVDDHELCVMQSDEFLSHKQGRDDGQKRWRMRIPLHFMEECVSLWPGNLGTNNDLRDLFTDGKVCLMDDLVTIRFSAFGRQSLLPGANSS